MKLAKHAVVQEFIDIQHLAATLGCWESINSSHIFAVKVHFIDSKWSL
jgi:hypothetical protein